MITGVDLVAQQLRIARGEPLPFKQSDITFNGHAIECRITAESPQHGFRPCPGRITQWQAPEGPAFDWIPTAIPATSCRPFTIRFLAKLIVHGGDRARPRPTHQAALGDLPSQGIDTWIPFLKRVIDDDEYRGGKVNTRWLEKKLEEYSAAQ